MALFSSELEQDGRRRLSRRRFLKGGLWSAGALALYAGEMERHWIEVAERTIRLPNLPAGFDGLRIAQLSDIHLHEYSEDFFLRHAVDKINRLQPEMVFLTGDYVSAGIGTQAYALRAASRCAEILTGLLCKKIYAVPGNHDVVVDGRAVMQLLTRAGVTVLVNDHLPLERGGGRIWLAGVDDPVMGWPRPELAMPEAIRNRPDEPILLLCHAPDYADNLLSRGVGHAVSLMLSGHTHGGQVRLPFLAPFDLPALGRKYIEGFFRVGNLQLYVNRGLGTVGVPFRFNCPPEITLITLRRG